MTSRSWSIGSSRSRARRATLLPLLEAERRRLRGAAVPRLALTVCCGFAGLRLVERRRLTLSPPWASPPPGGRSHPSTAAGGLCSTANARRSENGMDRPRSRPQRLSECLRGLSGEGALHASRIHGSRSDRHWNRYGQAHTAHGRSRFVWRHRAAREGLARTHRIEARESATLPHWHRSRDGDTLCCS